MSLSMSDAARVLALELRVAELEKQMAAKPEPEFEMQPCSGLGSLGIPDGTMLAVEVKRRGRPPKNLEERMKAQEHDAPDAE